MRKEVVLNILCVSILFCVFVYSFGLPSLEKYLSAGIQINKKHVELTEKETPAITICPQNHYTAHTGWKKRTKHLNDTCGDKKNEEEIYSCIDENVYNITELLREGSAVYLRKSEELNPLQDLAETTLWVPDISFSFFGRCFTLNQSRIGKPYKYKYCLDFLYVQEAGLGGIQSQSIYFGP